MWFESTDLRADVKLSPRMRRSFDRDEALWQKEAQLREYALGLSSDSIESFTDSNARFVDVYARIHLVEDEFEFTRILGVDAADYELEALDANYFGDTAVSRCVLGVTRDEPDHRQRIVWTVAWQCRDGMWVVLSSHACSFEDKP